MLMTVGIGIAALPWVPEFRGILVRTIQNASTGHLLIGSSLFTCGVLLLTVVYLTHKGTFYSVEMGLKKYCIDEAVVKHYLDNYWQTTFPNQLVDTQILIRHNQIEIQVHLPHVPQQEQQDFLKHTEAQISDLLQKFIGYHSPFLLTVSFATSN